VTVPVTDPPENSFRRITATRTLQTDPATTDGTGWLCSDPVIDWFDLDFFATSTISCLYAGKGDGSPILLDYQVAPGDLGSVFYSKTFQVMRTLEGLVGRDALHRAMGVYARRFAFKHPTGEDFLAVMNDELGDAAVRFLRPALAGTEVPDYRLIEMESFWVRPPLGVFGSGAARKTVADSYIELTIREGRNRQVRRMTAAVGLPTLRLVRIAIGPYRLDGLAPGQWREEIA
jgi:hypothetical protein